MTGCPKWSLLFEWPVFDDLIAKEISTNYIKWVAPQQRGTCAKSMSLEIRSFSWLKERSKNTSIHNPEL